ncbi:hypothetical protein BDQ12DRAFT_684726 [Crucibulum laeve]|uniref:Uncharacterized protein n=1 Tax=Crucibulum laeve TaxID=68775 RepID=A0A5C3M0G6_9AGAR|nr:hypothetical protein BDQ12DRAFT_684726 [Crucibulum laeve]
MKFITIISTIILALVSYSRALPTPKQTSQSKIISSHTRVIDGENYLISRGEMGSRVQRCQAKLRTAEKRYTRLLGEIDSFHKKPLTEQKRDHDRFLALKETANVAKQEYLNLKRRGCPL